MSENGSEKAANRELTTRERKRSKLDIVPLTPAALSNFTLGWEEVQASFVDNPASAVSAADRLVTEVMRERGYPVDDFDRRAADISVDHPEIVDDYRAAHDVTTSEQDDVSTEQRRDAFVHYRALFEKLLETTETTTRISPGGKRMTTHESQQMSESRDEPGAAVPDDARLEEDGADAGA